MHAVILAGGRGTRLGAAAAGTPKPMLDVGGRPFLERLLVHLAAHGFRRATLLVGHLASVVKDHFSSGAFAGVAVDCVSEPAPLGTGGALVAALPKLSDEFWLLNGDSFFDVDPSALAPPSAAAEDWGAVLALARVPDIGRYGAVDVSPDGRIVAFREKGGTGEGLINGGVYRMRRAALEPFKSARSLEQDIFPELATAGRLWGVEMRGAFIDIGTPDDLARARRDAPRLFAAQG